MPYHPFQPATATWSQQKHTADLPLKNQAHEAEWGMQQAK